VGICQNTCYKESNTTASLEIGNGSGTVVGYTVSQFIADTENGERFIETPMGAFGIEFDGFLLIFGQAAFSILIHRAQLILRGAVPLRCRQPEPVCGCAIVGLPAVAILINDAEHRLRM
jgi:hypothetical protein